MRHLFSLNAEGGPLLLCDALEVRAWSGADDSSDWEQLCAAFDGEPGAQGLLWSVGRGCGIAWEMNGAGSADAFARDDGGLVLIRAWVDDDSPDTFRRLAEIASTEQAPIG